MARGKSGMEVSERAGELLAQHRASDPVVVAAELARELFDVALSRGLRFEHALGAVFLGGIEFGEEGRPRRGRRSKGSDGGGDDGSAAP